MQLSVPDLAMEWAEGVANTDLTSVSEGEFLGISDRRDATKAFSEIRISNRGALL